MRKLYKVSGSITTKLVRLREMLKKLSVLWGNFSLDIGKGAITRKFWVNCFLAQGAFGSVVWQTVPTYMFIRAHVFEMDMGYFKLFYLLATIALEIGLITQSINRGNTKGAVWFIPINK